MDRILELFVEKWERLATWPRRMSIVTRLVVLLLVVLLVPLLVTASLNMERTVAMMKENEYLRLAQESRTTAGGVSQTVGDISRVLGILQTDPAVVKACEEVRAAGRERGAVAMRLRRERATAIRVLLARAAVWNKELDRVALADASGAWLAFSNAAPEEARHDAAAESCAKRALRGETITAESMDIGDGHGMYFAAPVEDADKVVIGALVVRMDHAVLQGLCDKGGPRQTVILDENGFILAHADPRRLGTPWNGRTERGDIPGTGVETDENGAVSDAARAPVRHVRWTVLVTQPRHVLEDAIGRLRRQQAAVAMLAAAGVLFLAIFQAREITRPLRALRLAALRVARGDLDAKAPILLRDEVGELAETFNHMTDRLRDHARLRDHLKLAQDIQRRLLPEVPPKIEGLELAGFNRAADETGGDYYDFVDLAEWMPDHLAVVVGDVTGHGVPAAILMATARAHIRASLCPPHGLARGMDDANRRLVHDTPPGRFITLAVVVVDAKNRRLRWSTAGHDGAMLFDAAKDRVSDLEGEDIPLGVDAGWRFHEHGGGTVAPGSVLVLGTDGLWETRNAKNEAFGKERIRTILHQNHAKGVEEIRRDIVMAADAFRGKAAQEDDLTLVVVKFAQKA